MNKDKSNSEPQPQDEPQVQQKATPFQIVETAINKAFKHGVFDMNEGAIVLNAMAAVRSKVVLPEDLKIMK